MFKISKGFSSFSIPDLQQAKQFYGETLGLEVIERPEGLELHIADAAPIFIYPSQDNKPAMYTVLNFIVDDIDMVVDEISRKGIRMEHYDTPQMKTDVKGILRNSGDYSGPKAIAWFKDPAGNILSLLEEK